MRSAGRLMNWLWLQKTGAAKNADERTGVAEEPGLPKPGIAKKPGCKELTGQYD